MWRTGLAGELPLGKASADAVVMTLLLHHLDRSAEQPALAEARRVLRPGGRLVIAGWTVPAGSWPRLVFPTLRVFDGAAGLEDHAAGRLPRLVAAAALRCGGRGASAYRLSAETSEVLTAERPRQDAKVRPSPEVGVAGALRWPLARKSAPTRGRLRRGRT